MLPCGWVSAGWWWWAVLMTTFLSGQSGFWLGVVEGSEASQGTADQFSGAINLGCIGMSSSIVFHFMFIHTGYALRGLRSPHVPMLKLTTVTSGCVALIATGAVCRCAWISDWVGITFMLATAVLMGRQGIACWWASEVFQRCHAYFPQSGVSHNWM